ncbi:peptide-methionine (R)-S-oxide reductase [Methanobrevibacter curvatus]|uniref:Peptide methionine sulfoxide reductase MsrB n=1 Tax=Methanobrevibacter curvatus TaxID=49547 RepID=A0A166BDU7_9EURY|nr:hypothetical protein [Methanobrevibacter curvatus]KZX13202.1 peptide methionine sulfoxide reductase MsrB [Methanobrevibacter curvatus]
MRQKPGTGKYYKFDSDCGLPPFSKTFKLNLFGKNMDDFYGILRTEIKIKIASLILVICLMMVQ